MQDKDYHDNSNELESIHGKALRFNKLMDMDWSQEMHEKVVKGNDWQPKIGQEYFTIWSYSKQGNKQVPYQCVEYASPHQALAYVNENHKHVSGKVVLSCGMFL